MTFFKDFLSGISGYQKAFKLYSEHKLWYFLVFPILVSLFFAMVLFYFRDILTSTVEAELESWFRIDKWPEWLAWMFGWLVWLIIWASTWYVFIKIQKFVVLIMLTPVLAIISEKTEEILTGKKYPFDFNQFVKDVLRGVMIGIGNLLIELSLIVVLFIISWVFPIITPFATVLGMFITWYFFGFALMDFTNERHKRSISDSYQLVWKHKGGAVGNGFLFELFLMIPVVGMVLGPILASGAATITFLHLEELKYEA